MVMFVNFKVLINNPSNKITPNQVEAAESKQNKKPGIIEPNLRKVTKRAF